MKVRKPLIYAILCSFLLNVASARSETVAERISVLEKKIIELENNEKIEGDLYAPAEGDTPVHSFFNDELFFGGFFEPAYLTIIGPNTPLQAAEVQSNLGLNISATFSERMRFVSQFIAGLVFPLSNEHNDPRAITIGLPSKRSIYNYSYGTAVAQVFLEYRISDHFLIQGGMGYVPFGYAFQMREPVLFERRGGPQMLRTNPLVTTLWSGINLQGEYALPPSSGKWGYNLYSFSPESNPEHPGAGGRVWWSQKNESLKVGLSTQVSKLGPLTAEVLGGDLEIRAKPFAVISEYAHGYTHSSVDPWSIYVEPSLMIYQEVVRLYLFADYADSPYNKTGSEVAGAFLDPYKQWEYGTGVNWLPTSYVRLRLGLTYHDYVGGTAVINGQNRNYYGIDVSAGVTF